MDDAERVRLGDRLAGLEHVVDRARDAGARRARRDVGERSSPVEVLHDHVRRAVRRARRRRARAATCSLLSCTAARASRRKRSTTSALSSASGSRNLMRDALVELRGAWRRRRRPCRPRRGRARSRYLPARTSPLETGADMRVLALQRPYRGSPPLREPILGVAGPRALECARRLAASARAQCGACILGA